MQIVIIICVVGVKNDSKRLANSPLQGVEFMKMLNRVTNSQNKKSIPLTMKIFYNSSIKNRKYFKKRFKYKELLFDIIWIKNTREARKLIRRFKKR